MSVDPKLPEEPTSSTPTPTPEDEKGGDPPAEQMPAEEPSENPQEAALAEMGAVKFYSRGDLVEGTIVQIADDSLVVDIGTKTEGIISRDEIGIGPSPDLSGFAVGDPVKAVVISEDEEGTYHLSKRRADQVLVWEKVEESAKEGTRMEATGFRAVKGGLLVDIGTIAFLPQSLCDIRRVESVEDMVGQKFEVKVVEYDRDAKPHPKIVVSRRAVMEEDLTRERDQVYDSLEVGAVTEGKVVKLTNYGAFVDLGGVQGLLHISEMSLKRIKHPSEVMKEGQTIKVKILKIDKRRKRVSLGRRDLLPNPWDTIHEQYKPGMVVEGVVVRTADFGAFIKLDDYFEGLAHISELVDNKISHAKEVFRPGDKVDVLIMNIDRRNRRIKLSVRRAAESKRRAEVDAYMAAQGDLGGIFGARLEEAVRDSEIELPDTGEAEEPPAEAPAEAVAETAETPPAEPEEETAEPDEPPVEEEPPEETTPEAGAVEEEAPEAEPEETEEAAAESGPALEESEKKPEEPAEEEKPSEEEPAEKPEEGVEAVPEIIDPSRDGTPI